MGVGGGGTTPPPQLPTLAPARGRRTVSGSSARVALAGTVAAAATAPLLPLPPVVHLAVTSNAAAGNRLGGPSEALPGVAQVARASRVPHTAPDTLHRRVFRGGRGYRAGRWMGRCVGG
jgi:hypothetical protein